MSAFGYIVIKGMVELFKMTFGYGCRDQFSIHTLNMFFIMLAGARIASVVLAISSMIVCCFPCLIVIIITGLMQNRQHQQARREVLSNIFTKPYDKLQTECNGYLPDISVAECSICMNKFHDEEGRPTLAAPMSCDIRHVFHKECIEAWFKRDNSCPLCKEVITDRKLKAIPAIIKQIKQS